MAKLLPSKRKRRAMAKKQRVPNVLWRLFGARARTLANTIISLIPSSPWVNCPKNCLRCISGVEDTMAFLLRPSDPSDYIELLNQCFVVIHKNAPPLSEFYPDNRRSQKQIVVRTIDMMMQQKSCNVMCIDYDKASQSSPIIELLTCSAWNLLLKRIGDEFMIYLLNHTSIFLPRPPKKYHQVVGASIIDLCFKSSKHKADPQPEHPPHFSIDQKKRKRSDDVSSVLETQHSSSSLMLQHCVCCSRLQARQLATPSDHISRRFVCHGSERSSTVLPAKHLLNSLKSNVADSKLLAEKVFGLVNVNLSAQSMPCIHSRRFNQTRSTCMYHSLVKLLKILIRRTKRCQHQKLLDKHCVVLMDQQDMKNSNSVFEGNEMKEVAHEKSNIPITEISKTLGAGHSKFEAIKPYCLRSQVVSFVWAVCRSIVPVDLLGTPSNWRVLRRNISKFLRLRRFEKFSLKQCMHKLKASTFPFLSDTLSPCYIYDQVLQSRTGKSKRRCKGFGRLNRGKDLLFSNWIFWFFSSLVGPIVQANFYVTETEFGKQEVYYYKRSVWQQININLENKSYSRLNDATASSIICNRSFGFSKIRLRPKKSGVRLLENLKAPSRLVARSSYQQEFKNFKSVNSALRNTNAVLKGLLLKESDKLGSSVFDYNGVYTKLCQFLNWIRHGSPTQPDLFIVVADASKAFDSIDQDKLFAIVNEVIRENEYVVGQSYEVSHRKRSLWVDKKLKLVDQTINNCNTRFLSSSTNPLFCSFIVNQGQSKCLKEELIFNLYEHVKHNVVQLDGKFYHQTVGIPQGGVLSSLLCSLYFGHLERNLLHSYLDDADQPIIEHRPDTSTSRQISSQYTTTSSRRFMLLRFIDDFLFVSTSMEQASNFLDILQRGFSDYNCYMNKEKFAMNFGIERVSGLPGRRVYIGQDGISFLRWSGLLINCSTLEIQGDYTRYLDNHLRSTLTVSWHQKPSHTLKERLYGFVRPKCHPIFFDPNINSAAVIRLNVYQVFLLCAMKFHCYVFELSYICKLSPISYLRVIEKSLRYMRLLIKKRMESVDRDSGLCQGEVEWLGLHAYIQVLQRKQSRYKELISLLRSKLFAHRITAMANSGDLKYAIHKSHSSSIWQIKY